MKYPNGKQKTNTTQMNSMQGQRGMSFEKYINISNEYYLAHDIACIHKKPTPIQVVKVAYTSNQSMLENKHAQIKEAYFQKPSTTDYNGIFKGVHIDFEAKECASKTTFSLKTIHPHQIKHMMTIKNMHGISFLLVYLKARSIVVLVDASIISCIYDKQATISIDKLIEIGTPFNLGAYPVVDYLKYVYEIYHKYFTDK